MEQPLQIKQVDLAAAAMQELDWEYGKPLALPPKAAAVCKKTSLEPSKVQIQNMSPYPLALILIYDAYYYLTVEPGSTLLAIVITKGQPLTALNVSEQATAKLLLSSS